MPIAGAFMVPHPPMIVPEVGRGSEKQIAKTVKAYETVAKMIAQLAPETILISSPHAQMYSDYFQISAGESTSGSFAQFRASGVRFREEYDTDLVRSICRIADEKQFPAGILGDRDRSLDHGTMVPLYFIRRKYAGFRIVRIGLSGLDLPSHYAMGQIIQQAVEETGRNCVYVASGDLSHKLQAYGPYGFAPEGPQYDARIMEVCGRGDFGELFDFDEAFCEKAAECGHRSFVIMAGALDGYAVDAQEYSHEDVTGVGYGICSFIPKEKSSDRYFLEQWLAKAETKMREKRAASDAYVQLARETIESYVREKKVPDLPADLPEKLRTEKAGVFVSIHKHGQLRGCIGTILPTESCVGREIIQNAVSAAAKDPRFDPVSEQELGWLEISVDVLGEPEDIDSPQELDVRRYGVIVSSGFRRGLLLPDLEGVDTVEQQIDIARRKAGIAPGTEMKLQRFEVIRHY